MNATLRLLPAAIVLLAASFHDPVGPPQEEDPVYVDEERKEFLDKVDRCRTTADWKGLFELHARASLPKNSHKLVRLRGLDARYVGLIEHMNRLFADLPPEALLYYRGQVDGAARREFDRARAAGDREGLERVVDTWFYSSRTDEALDYLANLHVEEGRLPLALHCWSRLLYHYPDSEIPQAVTAARLARAAAASGHDTVLEGVRRHVQERGVSGEVIVGNAPMSLQNFLGGLKVDLPSRDLGPPLREPSIATPGSAVDGRLTGVRPEIRRWSVELGGNLESSSRRGGVTQSATDFPFLPAYGRVGDHEMVVFTNGVRITVIDPTRANQARPEEGIYFSYPPPGESVLRPAIPQDMRGTGPITWVRPYIGVTVDGEHAFATLYSGKRVREAPGPGGMGGMATQDTLYGTTRLVCLNLRTQQVVWDTDFGEAGTQLRKLEFWDKNFSFAGPPLVRGDRIYAGVGTSPLMEEESRVLCFDRATGVPLWERYLASVTSSRPFWSIGGNYTSRLTVLEEDRGTLVAHSNLGVIAALDSVTGQVRWLSKYPRLNTGPNQWGQSLIFARPASPVVIHRGRVYALPQDAAELLVVDLATGAIQKDGIKLGDTSTIGPRQWREFQRMAGRMGDFLVFGGAGSESCVLNTATGNFYGLLATNVSGTGRGTIDGETLYLPCMDLGRGGLSIFHGVKSWSSFEKSIIWWPLGEGGNVVRAGNYLVFASTNKISILTDTEVVRAEYRRRLEQSPPNPAAWFDYGKLMQGNERWSEAARGFLSFIEAVEGDAEWMDRAREVRTELHGIFLKLGIESSARKLPVDAAAHFGRARDFAWDDATLTEATRLLAGACEAVAETHGVETERRTWARRAVEEYQELMRRSPRGFVKPGEPMLWIPSRKYASSRIAALVKKHGEDSYAGVERAAREELKRAGKGPVALAAMADLYPDSAAAVEAVERIVELAVAQERWTAVASGLRDIRVRLGDRWTPAHQKRLHDVLEKIGDAERLEEEFARMERLFEGAAKMGTEESSPTVADYLAKARPAAAGLPRRPVETAPGSIATLSTWDPPAPAAGANQIPLGWYLVAPGGLEPPKWSPDLEFFARGSSIELWNIRTKKKVWTAIHPGSWTGIVYSEPAEEGRGVRVMEVLTDSPAARAGLNIGDVIRSVDGVSVGESDFDFATEGRAPGTRLTIDYKRGDEARRTDLTTVAWPASFRPSPVGAAFTSDGALAVAWEDLVAAFDSADGKPLWVSRPSRHRFVIRAIHSTGGRIVVHEQFTAEKCRSPLRVPGDRAAKAPLSPEDQHSRLIALDESDGEPAWAAGFRFDVATSAHQSVVFLGRPLDSHVALVVSGYLGTTKTIEAVAFAATDGKEARRITLSGTGGQPASAWIVEPVTGTLWVVEASMKDRRTLRSFSRPDFLRAHEIALENHVDPAAVGFGLAATEDRVAVVSVSRGLAAPRLAVFSARDGKLIASHKPNDGPLKDRVLPGLSSPTPELRLLGGLLSLEPDGTLILYTEAKPGQGTPPPVRRASITALSVEGGAFKVVWEAVTPTLTPAALAEREVLSIRSGPKGVFVTTFKGIPPGKMEECAVVAFHSRKEGWKMKKVVDDLVVPNDAFGVRRDPTPAHRGRIFLNRKGGLEILGD